MNNEHEDVKQLMEFIKNVFSNIIASLFVAFLGWISRQIWLKGFYSDIEKVYKYEKRALRDINIDIEKSKFVKILAIRGKSIADKKDGKYPSLWKKAGKNIEIIISDKNNQEAIKARSDAIGCDSKEYKMDIEYSNKILRNRMRSNNNLLVYNHKENLSFKLIILEHCIYVCYFLPKESVHKSNVVKYKSNTGAYDAYLHFYSVLKNSNSTLLSSEEITAG